MNIGMMAPFKNPTELAKFTSMICKSYGIELIYLRAKDVNIENGTVRGKIFFNNEWHEKESEIPQFIDISPYSFKRKNRVVTSYLKRKTFLSDDRKNVLTKRTLQEYLRQDPEFSSLVIPTFDIIQYKDLQRYSEQYSKFVLKPSGGIQGKGIYIIEKHNNKYLIGHKITEKSFDEDEMEKFYKENIHNKGYIFQKYITSRTPQGDPFDCRIHVEKNGDGEWESARNYIRIGIGQKVVSNVNQGGGIADVKQFLKANYGEKGSEINERLNTLAMTLPYKVEQLRGTHIMSLGIDIGISKDGELYIFEVNDGPSTKPVISEVAYLRSNYYKYILEHKLGIWEEAPNVRYEDYIAVVKDRNFYKKNYNKIKTSTSWRLTAPLRKAGSLKKKL